MDNNKNVELNRKLLEKINDKNCHSAILDHILEVHSLPLPDLIYFSRKICEVLNPKQNEQFDEVFVIGILEILWAVASKEVIENEPALLLLHSLFTFVRNEKLTIRILKQILISVNQLLKSKETLIVFRTNDRNNETVDYLGKRLATIGDYEAQAVILETIFRYTDKSNRAQWAKQWFQDDTLCSFFLSFNLALFEVDCRKFLMALNDYQAERKRVYSFVAESIVLGGIKVHEPRGSQLWVDFNLGSKTLSFYCEEISNEQQSNDDSLWETIILSQESIAACALTVGEKKSQHLQIKLHHPCSELLSSTLSATEEPPSKMKGSFVDLFFNESLNIHPFIVQIFGDFYLGQTVESSEPQADKVSRLPVSFDLFHSSGEMSQVGSQHINKTSVSSSPLLLEKSEMKMKDASISDFKSMKTKVSLPAVPLVMTWDDVITKCSKTETKIPEVEIKASEKSIADANSNAMVKTNSESISSASKENKSESVRNGNLKSIRNVEQHMGNTIIEQHTRNTALTKGRISVKKVKTPIPIKVSTAKKSKERKKQNAAEQARTKNEVAVSKNSNRKLSSNCKQIFRGTFCSDNDTSSEVSWISKKFHLFETPRKTYFKSSRRKPTHIYYEEELDNVSAKNAIRSERTRTFQDKAQKNIPEVASPYNVEALLDETKLRKNKRNTVQQKKVHKAASPSDDVDWKEIDSTSFVIEKKNKPSGINPHTYNFRSHTRKTAAFCQKKEYNEDNKTASIMPSPTISPLHHGVNAEKSNKTFFRKQILHGKDSENLSFEQKEGEEVTSGVVEISPVHNMINEDGICNERQKAEPSVHATEGEIKSLWQEKVSPYSEDNIEKLRSADSSLEITANSGIDMLENSFDKLEKQNEFKLEETRSQISEFLNDFSEHKRNYNSTELSHMKQSLESYFKSVPSPVRMTEDDLKEGQSVPLFEKKTSHHCSENVKSQNKNYLSEDISHKCEVGRRLRFTDDSFPALPRTHALPTCSINYVQTSKIPQKLITKYEELSKCYVSTVQKYSMSLNNEMMTSLQNIAGTISEMEIFVQSHSPCNAERSKLKEKLAKLKEHLTLLEEAEAILQFKMTQIQKRIAAKYHKELEKSKEEIFTELCTEALHQLRCHLMSFMPLL